MRRLLAHKKGMPPSFTFSLTLLLLLCFRPVRVCTESAAVPGPLATILSSVGLPPENAQALIFAAFEAFYLREELIALRDYGISVNQAKRSDNSSDGLVIVPGSSWNDAAAGSVLIMGVSATMLIDNASLVTDTLVRLGIDIPLSTAQGQSNIPGSIIGGGYWASGVPGVRLNPRRGLIEKPSRRGKGAAVPRGRKLTAAAAAAASPADAAFLQSWFEMLPVRMQDDAAAWLLSLGDGNLTITSPQHPLNIATIFITGLFDIEVSLRILAIENQNAFANRLASALRLGSDGSADVGLIVQPAYTSFLTTTIQQLAGLGAAALALDRAAFWRALAGEVKEQTQPLPLTFTVGFEVLLRAQLSENAGDIASVF